MNMDFAARMRAAMKLMQEQKLMEATRVIQSALSGVNQPGCGCRRGVAPPWKWSCLVGRQPERLVHGSARPGRIPRNAAVLLG